MRLFQAPLQDLTPVLAALLFKPFSSRFARHGLRGFEKRKVRKAPGKPLSRVQLPFRTELSLGCPGNFGGMSRTFVYNVQVDAARKRHTNIKFVLVDVSVIFYFFCSGEGEGGVRGAGMGGETIFFWKSQEGGAKYFFFGAEIPSKFWSGCTWDEPGLSQGCESLGHLQNRKTPKSRKQEKKRQKIGEKQAKNKGFSYYWPIFLLFSGFRGFFHSVEWPRLLQSQGDKVGFVPGTNPLCRKGKTGVCALP